MMKMYSTTCTPSEDSDQPVHLCSISLHMWAAWSTVTGLSRETMSESTRNFPNTEIILSLYFRLKNLFNTEFSINRSIFPQNRDFIIQERFNKLIYGINTIIKCDTWQPVKFQLVPWEWYLSYFWLNVANFNQFIKPFLEKKCLFLRNMEPLILETFTNMDSEKSQGPVVQN